jgi:CheY-like chemotaxis protein
MSLLILVVDDEPDVETLFRQQFRRDIRDGRFTMDFALSADRALQLISDAAAASLILILSDINMPGMTGLELLPKAKAARPDVPVIMITAYGDPDIMCSPKIAKNYSNAGSNDLNGGTFFWYGCVLATRRL